MTTYDPAWDMPTLNWRQQGSFEAGAVPPTVEPDAGTQIFLGPFAEEWMPYICGALDQLRNPSAWVVADDDAMYNTLRRVDTLLGLICAVRADCVPVLMQLANCVLQTSTDGGVTWVPVTGWIENFGHCVRDNIPPDPPQIGPGPINQYACNLAGYLSTEIIQRAMANASTDWSSGARTLNNATTLFDQYLGFAFPETAFALTAFNLFWGYWSAGTIAGFTAAAADPALFGLITCAIFTAIRNDGKVTDANFPVLVANVCAVTYATPSVVAAICTFVTNLGAVNLRAMQVTGALEDIDCTACTETWCYQWDLLADPGPFLHCGSAGAFGTWILGQGWVGTQIPATTWWGIDLAICGLTAVSLTFLELTYLSHTAEPSPGSYNYTIGTFGTLVSYWTPIADGAPHVEGGTYSEPAATEFGFRLQSTGAPGSTPPVIGHVLLRGNGVNPFGADNCV
jgi:hypothetical protein